MGGQQPRMEAVVVVPDAVIDRWQARVRIGIASVAIAVLCLLVFVVIRRRRRKSSVI